MRSEESTGGYSVSQKFLLVTTMFIGSVLASTFASQIVVLSGSQVDFAVFAIIGICAAASFYGTHYFSSPKYRHLFQLVEINNAIPLGEASITTVREFLTATKEESLTAGDRVMILTNNLRNYDLLPGTVKIIADNIKEGVIYEYFLPVTNDPTLREELKSLMEALIRHDIRLNMLKENLRIHDITDPLTYSYAIVQQNRETRAYWYVATEPQQSDAKLAIIRVTGRAEQSLAQMPRSIRSTRVEASKIV